MRLCYIASIAAEPLRTLCRIAQSRVETKILVFVFSRKFRKKIFRFSRKKLTKSCENFRENFRFRESFCEKFHFCEIFCDNFPFGMRIQIQEPPECVSC
jgi:hypothetical protein